MRWFAAVWLLAACGSSTARTGHGASPPAGPWTWTASVGGPWRLPRFGFDVAVAPGDDRVVIRTGARQALVVELATGAVGAPTAIVPAPGTIDTLVRVGDRMLAFGLDDGAAAAWELTAAPLAATALAVQPDGELAKPELTTPGIAVSPDATRVFVCGARRWPVLRDAATLAVIRVFRIVTCRDPTFADAGHVLIRGANPVLIDLATGAVTHVVPRGPFSIGGPGGRTLTVSEYSQWRFTDAAGAELGVARGYGTPRWLPDGSGVVTVSAGQLVVQPASGGEAKKIGLPIAEPTSRYALTGTGTAVVVIARAVIAVDLAAGTTRTAEGNVGRVSQVAAGGGSVVIATNRLRAWRDGRLVANGEAGVTSFDADPPGSPVVTLGAAAVSLWDPTTGDRRVVHELEDTGTIVRRGGDRIVFDDGSSVFVGRRGRRPARWFRFRDDLGLAALDVAAGRVGWLREDGYHIADVDRGQVWSFCELGDRLAFDPGRPRAGTDDGMAVQLYDLAAQRALVGVELEDQVISAWAFVPTTGELVIAGDGEVSIVDPVAGTGVAWSTGDDGEPAAIDVDATGTELAIAYVDGGVRWATLAGARAHARRRPVISHPPPGADCPEAPLGHPTLDELVIDGGDDDIPAGDLDCDDNNDDPDDDCAVIYGTPE